MSKKAQGLSMNVIIIAAIALLVLVILATFLLNAGGDVGEGTSCTGMGGECHPVGDGETCNDYMYEEGKTFIKTVKASCAEGDICCIPLG